MGLSWFRRSRRNDAKQASAVDMPALSRQARAPLRIRGLLVLNLQPADGIAQIETAPPLGSRAGVIDAIAAVVPGIRFTDGHGELAGEGHHVTLDLGAGDPVHALVAAAEGDGGIEMLIALLRQTGWRAYAPRAGVFIEPDALDLFALPDGAPPAPR
jgi:hypothetical protein